MGERLREHRKRERTVKAKVVGVRKVRARQEVRESMKTGKHRGT